MFRGRTVVQHISRSYRGKGWKTKVQNASPHSIGRTTIRELTLDMAVRPLSIAILDINVQLNGVGLLCSEMELLQEEEEDDDGN